MICDCWSTHTCLSVCL